MVRERQKDVEHLNGFDSPTPDIPEVAERTYNSLERYMRNMCCCS